MSTAPCRLSCCIPVTNILVWTECYALVTVALMKKYPDKELSLRADLKRMTHAARNFHGIMWVAYNRLHCSQALAKQNLDWAYEHLGSLCLGLLMIEQMIFLSVIWLPFSKRSQKLTASQDQYHRSCPASCSQQTKTEHC